MKWTVLSDNRSRSTFGRLQGKNERQRVSDDTSGISRLSTEHGLSILLETEQYRILLDTGASDVFIRNAEVLGIDLSTVDYVFISHGHSDHAGGLRFFLSRIDKPEDLCAFSYEGFTYEPKLGERLRVGEHSSGIPDFPLFIKQ